MSFLLLKIGVTIVNVLEFRDETYFDAVTSSSEPHLAL